MSVGRLFHTAGPATAGECPVAKTKSGARDDEVSTSCRAESGGSGN